MIEALLNRYLALDPESTNRLKDLAGKVVQIDLQPLDLVFQLLFTKTEIKVSFDEKEIPHTIIKGSPLSLLRMSLSDGDRKKFFSKETTITGDLELGQQVIDLFDQLEIDWEEMLAQKIGDVPAHNIGKLTKSLKKFCDSTRESFRQNIDEYVHEEKLWFPQREILQEFFDEVDALRMDVDRAEIKIKNLKND